MIQDDLYLRWSFHTGLITVSSNRVLFSFSLSNSNVWSNSALQLSPSFHPGTSLEFSKVTELLGANCTNRMKEESKDEGGESRRNDRVSRKDKRCPGIDTDPCMHVKQQPHRRSRPPFDECLVSPIVPPDVDAKRQNGTAYQKTKEPSK